MAKKFSQDFSKIPTIGPNDRLLIERASDSKPFYILLKDVIAGLATGQSVAEAITSAVKTLQPKVDGKGLSTNDFSNNLKDKLDNIDLSQYRLSDDNSGLSEENFTSILKEKLEGLNDGGSAPDLSHIEEAIQDLSQLVQDKPSSSQIGDIVEASTLHVDMATAKGSVYPNPTESEPAVGTVDNPIALPAEISVTNNVQSGNSNPVTSAGVFNAISLINTDLQQKYNELYNMISSGKTTPERPEITAVDDIANTVTFSNKGGLTNAETEITFDAGITIASNSANPFSVPDANYDVNTVGIRYRATGERNASLWSFNQTPFTGSVSVNGMLPGFVRPTFEGIITPNQPVDLGNGSLGAPGSTANANGSGNGTILTKHYFQNGSRVAAKIGPADKISAALGSARQYDIRGIRGAGFWDDGIHPFNENYGIYEEFIEGIGAIDQFGVLEYVAATNSFDFYVGVLHQDGTATYQKLTPRNGFIVNDVAGDGGRAYFQIDVYDGLRLENIQMFKMLTDTNV